MTMTERLTDEELEYLAAVVVDPSDDVPARAAAEIRRLRKDECRLDFLESILVFDVIELGDGTIAISPIDYDAHGATLRKAIDRGMAR